MNVFLDALRAAGRTGLLHPNPGRAAWLWLALTVRHGVSLYSVAAWSAARFPDAPALVEPEGTTTFRGLAQQADLIADALAGRVRPGAPSASSGVTTPPSSPRCSPAGGWGCGRCS